MTTERVVKSGTNVLVEQHPKTYLTLPAPPEQLEVSTRSLAHGPCEAVTFERDTNRDGDFWSKVLRTECCWLWTRALYAGTGYGAVWVGGRLRKAHRVAYELTTGPLPDGLDIMHTCDVRRCVRPDHLRSGTRKENQQDMVAKNRHAPQDGENNHNARFNWPEIREVRAEHRRGVRTAVIAERHNSSPAYINRIVRRFVWRYDPLEATPAQIIKFPVRSRSA